MLLRALERGSAIQPAMRAAGYPEWKAKLGKAGLPKALKEKYNANIRKKLAEKAELGRALTPEEQKGIVRRALLQNVAEGQDRGPQSLKLLGSTKELGMFAHDDQGNVIVINIPSELVDSLSRYQEGPGTRRVVEPDGGCIGQLPENSGQ